MIHPGNDVVRRQKRIGAGLLAASILFVGLSAAGLVFPRAGSPDTRIVEFDVGSRVSADHEARIAAVADMLLDAPETIAVITGHSGSDGDPEANQRLSEQRAATVAEMLKGAGIPETRIVTRGAAGSAPVTPEDGESPASVAQRTKRAEIRIVDRNMLDQGMLP